MGNYYQVTGNERDTGQLKLGWNITGVQACRLEPQDDIWLPSPAE